MGVLIPSAYLACDSYLSAYYVGTAYLAGDVVGDCVAAYLAGDVVGDCVAAYLACDSYLAGDVVGDGFEDGDCVAAY